MEDTVRIKRYFGLKVARLIFKALTFLSAFFVIVLVVLQVVASLRDPEVPINTVLSVVSFDSLLRVLLFYTMYQIIDIMLSINDGLRQLARAGQNIDKTPLPTDDSKSHKRVMALLEKQHRRIEQLEKERND